MVALKVQLFGLEGLKWRIKPASVSFFELSFWLGFLFFDFLFGLNEKARRLFHRSEPNQFPHKPMIVGQEAPSTTLPPYNKLAHCWQSNPSQQFPSLYLFSTITVDHPITASEISNSPSVTSLMVVILHKVFEKCKTCWCHVCTSEFVLQFCFRNHGQSSNFHLKW